MRTTLIAAATALAAATPGTAAAETTATCHFEVRLAPTASGLASGAEEAVCAGVLGHRTAIPGVRVRVEGVPAAGSRCEGPAAGRITLLVPALIDFGPSASLARVSADFTTHGAGPGARRVAGTGESDVDAVALAGSTTFVADHAGCAGGTLVGDIVLTSAGPRPQREPAAAPPPAAAAGPAAAKPRRACGKRRSANRRARCARPGGRRS